jgi:hypothetical protein
VWILKSEESISKYEEAMELFGPSVEDPTRVEECDALYYFAESFLLEMEAICLFRLHRFGKSRLRYSRLVEYFECFKTLHGNHCT